MAKVITFSRRFPAGHPKKGQDTNFVERFWCSASNWPGTIWLKEENAETYPAIDPQVENWRQNNFRIRDKKHTIRGGNRFKAGDIFSPRVWSEGPYKSPMVKISRDTKILRTWDIKLDIASTPENAFLDIVHINGVLIPTDRKIVKQLARNDGLSEEDFRAWFRKPFEGQIICWDDSVEY